MMNRTIPQKMQEEKDGNASIDRLWSTSTKIKLSLLLYGFLVATAFAKSVDYLVRNEIEIQWGFLVIRSSLLWGILVAAVPFFMITLRRFNLKRKQKLGPVLVLSAQGLGFVVMHSCLFVMLLSLIQDGTLFRPELISSVTSNVIFNAIPLLSAYFLFVGGWHLVEYIKSYKHQELSVEKRKAELMEVKLHTLRQQLSPHYLFNTLHGIHSLMYEQSEQAVAMLGRLKQLLEASSDDKQADVIPLREELNLATSYLNIEKMRHGDRLQIDYDVAPEVMDVNVPTMILQPLLENSIRYAVTRKIEPSQVKVRAWSQDQRLHISVEDDGPGWGSAIEKGIGLQNTEKRVGFMHTQAEVKKYPSALGGAGIAITWPLN